MQHLRRLLILVILCTTYAVHSQMTSDDEATHVDVPTGNFLTNSIATVMSYVYPPEEKESYPDAIENLDAMEAGVNTFTTTGATVAGLDPAIMDNSEELGPVQPQLRATAAQASDSSHTIASRARNTVTTVTDRVRNFRPSQVSLPHLSCLDISIPIPSHKVCVVFTGVTVLLGCLAGFGAYVGQAIEYNNKGCSEYYPKDGHVIEYLVKKTDGVFSSEEWTMYDSDRNKMILLDKSSGIRLDGTKYYNMREIGEDGEWDDTGRYMEGKTDYFLPDNYLEYECDLGDTEKTSVTSSHYTHRLSIDRGDGYSYSSKEDYQNRQALFSSKEMQTFSANSLDPAAHEALIAKFKLSIFVGKKFRVCMYYPEEQTEEKVTHDASQWAAASVAFQNILSAESD